MKTRRLRWIRVAMSMIILAALMARSIALPYQVLATAVPRVYWGALVGGNVYGSRYGNAPYDTYTWDLFEQHAGKKVSILSWPEPWYNNGWQSFPTLRFSTVRSRGAIPLLTWNSCCGPSQATWSLRHIATGATNGYNGQTFDQYVTSWAEAAKAWGHPFFLRFDQEMNGWWSSWSTAANPQTGDTVNNNTPQDYVNAWRHVHDIFTHVGATNVTWVWCPNVSSRYTTPLTQLYPGDSYVDWTCLDGYNNSASIWQTFSQIYSGDASNGYHNSYAEITSVAPSKPLMIGEWASTEADDGGARKAVWITDALSTEIPTIYPRIKAVVWFNDIPPTGRHDAGNPYDIESTAAAQSAFATAISSPFYATNSFGTITTSPISPL